MHFTAEQIASLIQGKVEGDPQASVSKVAKIEDASTGDLSFVANPKYEEYLYKSNASIIIVNDSLNIESSVKATLIKVKDAYSSFALLLERYNDLISNGHRSGIDSTASVSESAKIGADVYVGAFAYIGDNAHIAEGAQIYPGCVIGDNAQVGTKSKVYSGVRIYNDCIIGDNVIIHSGTVIGSDGFGFAPQKDGSYKKIPQIGNVIVEDNVEIGANCTIDRATMGSTRIKKGVKLDNLIQIAHNVEIGENTVIAAQTGISGSTKIGRNCVIGGQVGIVGHITIADYTSINAQSGLAKSVNTPKTALTGSPAYDYKSSLKSQAIFRNLPEIQQRLISLEKTVEELSALLSEKNISDKK
ncbi:MAG: UDP-3-O-(3-hydroxymyristoyl)glucosamine N-acyltransferase [Chitinophagales bacterium]|nr:UDP-3-O-(3-hydroxymyristoyl)glucosamine N-acyltransferase [Chitinophagaceae bacterium]MCB9064411.1 UDP-3-O-(3-hydroxymyristoyl)glucosamine N-acyltransferase [Chitinophagales bacterium]